MFGLSRSTLIIIGGTLAVMVLFAVTLLSGGDSTPVQQAATQSVAPTAMGTGKYVFFLILALALAVAPAISSKVPKGLSWVGLAAFVFLLLFGLHSLHVAGTIQDGAASIVLDKTAPPATASAGTSGEAVKKGTPAPVVERVVVMSIKLGPNKVEVVAFPDHLRCSSDNAHGYDEVEVKNIGGAKQQLRITTGSTTPEYSRTIWFHGEPGLKCEASLKKLQLEGKIPS